MSNQVIRDQKRRVQFSRYELKRMLYKAISQDRKLSPSDRYEYSLKLSKMPRNSSRTRIRNRCILTGRSRAVYKMFRLSRIVFRELASRGALLGISKSSW
uniref:Small ribosomal subunit protein uS14m n=1 Tax=Gonatozygon brebissonii TaxID=184482 RepID=A0A6G9IF38_9VIRI|nr:ribosomal protein S14 [Gonatozygon brebissonii]QIQ23079.1 ribosomal protein S14 [Gonatozygon brebissonii]